MHAPRLTRWAALLAALLTVAGGAVAAPHAPTEVGAAEALAASSAAHAPVRYGAENTDSRILLSARDKCWVQVMDSSGRTLFQRLLKAGESYRVPNRQGLRLTTGSARVLDITVDGETAPSLGALGAVRRDVPLDPDRLLAGADAKPASDSTSASAKAPDAKAADSKTQPIALWKTPSTATTNDKLKKAAVTHPPKPRRVSRSSQATAIPATGVVNGATVLERTTPLTLEAGKGTLLRLDRPASTVFVANPDIADVQVKSPSLIYVFAKIAGETVLYAVDSRNRVLLNTTISVTHNLGGLRQAINNLLPDNRIELNSVDGAIVLSGTVNSAVKAEDARRVAQRFVSEEGEVINQIDVAAPNQINLRVRIAEVSRDVFKAFGFNFEAIADIGDATIAFATGSDIEFSDDGALLRNVTDDGDLLNNFFSGYRGENLAIDSMIDALASEGLITILAEPNLTAMSGETASFLAGGEFPIPVASDDEKITIAFKEFGVSLNFTPTILDGGRINLHVRPEVSQISSVGAIEANDIVIPALTTRRAETTVELASGQSFAIAGLLQNNTTQDLSKVPALGDLPVLGTLFRSDRFRRNETELVIIVTPYLVRPVSEKRLATPLDGFTPPTDVERILGGKTYRQQLSSNDQTPRIGHGRGLIGPAGFELE